MANRGQNGIDGVVSTAVGAAQHFAQTTFLTGDFTLLHDLSGLALQREMLLQRRGPEGTPSLVIVLLNNNGGAIFDMLPQASADPYFERLFLAPPGRALHRSRRRLRHPLGQRAHGRAPSAAPTSSFSARRA